MRRKGPATHTQRQQEEEEGEMQHPRTTVDWESPAQQRRRAVAAAAAVWHRPRSECRRRAWAGPRAAVAVV